MRKHLLSTAIALTALAASAHPIDFDQIRHWTGTGPNRAALVVQFNGDTYGTDAYVWGYRWEEGESPTGEDMMKAICANSSRLAMLTQYTGVYGSTLCGVGYSLNQEILKHVYFNFDKAKEFEFINFDYYNVNSFMGQTEAPGDNAPAMAQEAIDRAVAGSHYIQHPFDYHTYGYPAYDYDCWDIDEDTEMRGGSSLYEPKWLSAWYEGYWSYWCANSPDQEWMYSGTGFTGRMLTDGAVDGWSFTQFENAMVGGMGEGVAPCEDGAIFYMPARSGAPDIDPDKCVRTLGSGVNSMPLLVRTGVDNKIDNMVFRIGFNDAVPTLNEVLTLLSADPAFNIDGNTVSIDADGDGVFGGNGDDIKCEGDWTLAEYEDCLVLACGEPKTPRYLLYMPQAGLPAVVLPETLAYALSDNTDYLPIFVQREAMFDQINYTTYYCTDEAGTDRKSSNDIISSITTYFTTYGKITYKGDKAGEVFIQLRARTGVGSSYSFSNICRFTLMPPAVPVESIAFESSSVDAPLNSKVENRIILSPEDATYTALTYTTSNNKVASASNGSFKTTKTPGTATITVKSKWNPVIGASFDITSALLNPVEDVAIKGVEGDVITLNPKEMLGIIPEVVPADADIPDFNVTLSGNGTAKDNYIATMYKVNYWDENNTRIQFYELSGHRAGECTLTLTSTDGSGVSKTFTVRVEEQDRTPLENGYTDGTLILNEEWFGHTNGGMNYITPEGEMMYQVYERENPGMSFGCTSQYAMIWAGRLIAISKQAADGGDPLPGGGRVVVADARTLRHIGSIDNLDWNNEYPYERIKSADGRAAVGATPDKIYVGSSNGIYIVDLNEVRLTGKITDFDETGEAGADLYNGQIGDMVNAGRHVFGIKQDGGAFAIDTETDRVVKRYDIANVQGVTQSADGNVWIASVEDGRGRFTCIDPATLEVNDALSITLPEGISGPTCSWGAWRNTPFIGSHTRNVIWFSTGGGIAGGSAKDRYFGWEVGTDPYSLQPAFDMSTVDLPGSNPRVHQKTYGTLRYDERSGELIVMTTEDGASGHYRYNWTHFIDPDNHEIKRTIALRPYYWFQAFAIFPDKYDAEIALDNINVISGDGSRTIDLARYVTDLDNIDANISFAVTPASADGMTHSAVSLDGSLLTLAPLSNGTDYLTLAATSNGRTVSKTIPVTVGEGTIFVGIDGIGDDTRSIECDGRRLHVRGFAGHDFSIIDISGRRVASFHADDDNCVFDFGGHSGVYVVSSDNGLTTKVIVR